MDSNHTCLAVISLDFIKRWKLLSASVFERMEIYLKKAFRHIIDD